MKFVNVGAIDASGGARFTTKAALKRNLAEGNAAFDQTAYPHDGSLPGVIEVKDIPEDVTLVVVGPDPYTRRNWYANVKIGRNGKLVCS